jgi:Ca2+/Na+ antiporter
MKEEVGLLVVMVEDLGLIAMERATRPRETETRGDRQVLAVQVPTQTIRIRTMAPMPIVITMILMEVLVEGKVTTVAGMAGVVMVVVVVVVAVVLEAEGAGEEEAEGEKETMITVGKILRMLSILHWTQATGTRLLWQSSPQLQLL